MMTEAGPYTARWTTGALFSLLTVEVAILGLWRLGALPLSTAARASMVTAIAWLVATGMVCLLVRVRRQSRRFQLSLRGFFAAVTGLCFLLSCFALLSSAVRQHAAVANMGAAAEWVPGPQWLTQLLGEDCLGTATMVYSDRQGFTDSDLVHVKYLRNLKQLYLPGTGVSDNGLENLVGLHELEELGLDNTQVTDAALASLQKLTSLRRVILTGTRVTESGVTELKRSLPDARVEW